MPTTPNTIANAKDLDTLGKVVSELAKTSVKAYTDASVSAWKILGGDVKWDAEKLAKNTTTIWGRAAADATNATLMLQRLATLLSKDP